MQSIPVIFYTRSEITTEAGRHPSADLRWTLQSGHAVFYRRPDKGKGPQPRAADCLKKMWPLNGLLKLIITTFIQSVRHTKCEQGLTRTANLSSESVKSIRRAEVRPSGPGLPARPVHHLSVPVSVFYLKSERLNPSRRRRRIRRSRRP